MKELQEIEGLSRWNEGLKGNRNSSWKLAT
jgi:hypothetical protein